MERTQGDGKVVIYEEINSISIFTRLTRLSICLFKVKSVCVSFFLSPFLFPFLVADERLYKRLCPSVGPLVRWSVGPSVRRSVGPSVSTRRKVGKQAF